MAGMGVRITEGSKPRSTRIVKVMSWPFLRVKTLVFSPHSWEICVPGPFSTGLQPCALMKQSVKFRQTKTKAPCSTGANENAADEDRNGVQREQSEVFMHIAALKLAVTTKEKDWDITVDRSL